MGRLLHIDDLERLDFLEWLLRQKQAPQIRGEQTRRQRLFAMLHFALWGSSEPLDHMQARLEQLWMNQSRREELAGLIQPLRDLIHRVTRPIDITNAVPLQLHARYSRDEALAAFGVDNPGSVRQGVKWVESERADVFFVTLRKVEKHYSPTTMYQDRAMTPSLFQWESQSTTSTASPMGQRYVHHKERASTIHLFIREGKEGDGDLGAPPYLYAGPASYVSHDGDRPMRILWKLASELPADLFHAAQVATG